MRMKLFQTLPTKERNNPTCKYSAKDAVPPSQSYQPPAKLAGIQSFLRRPHAGGPAESIEDSRTERAEQIIPASSGDQLLVSQEIILRGWLLLANSFGYLSLPRDNIHYNALKNQSFKAKSPFLFDIFWDILQ
jgi:hypothetical protein